MNDTSVQKAISTILQGESIDTILSQLLSEDTCPTCGDKDAYINLSNQVDCPSKGCKNYKLGKATGKKPEMPGFTDKYDRHYYAKKVYTIHGHELKWNGQGSLGDLKKAVKPHYNKLGENTRVSYKHYNSTKYLLTIGKTNTGNKAWLIYAGGVKKQSFPIRPTFSSNPAILKLAIALEWLWDHVKMLP